LKGYACFRIDEREIMSQLPYRLQCPQPPQSCVVFNSPHSGDEYPADFLSMTRLNSVAIRSSEDAYVDRLFETAPLVGAPLMAARFPRAFVDLNRGVDEMDPALVRGVKYHGINPRISAGLGVIPRVVGGYRAIRNGKISLIEANRRINLAYHPYHDRLAQLVDAQFAIFGRVILLDCHSMPQESIASYSQTIDGMPDVVLGNRFGASCDADVFEAVAGIFETAGFKVRRNEPFAGGYITQKYGQPACGMHAVQIEINRSLYMNEATVEIGPDFTGFQRSMAAVTAGLVRLGMTEHRIAAE